MRAADRSTTRKLVYVIDDDLVMRGGFTRLLRAVGYEVESFASPCSALMVAEQRIPDVIVTELDMPALSAVELSQRLSAVLGDQMPPILLVSGSVRRLPRENLSLFRACVEKPFDPTQLLDALDSCIETRAADSRIRIKPVDPGS